MKNPMSDLTHLVPSAPEETHEDIRTAAKAEAEEREAVFTALKGTKDAVYRNDTEILANYFGRVGGFYAGVEWALKEIRAGRIKL
jgi:hypothetical protein